MKRFTKSTWMQNNPLVTLHPFTYTALLIVAFFSGFIACGIWGGDIVLR